MGLREDAEQARKDSVADLGKKQKEHIEKVFGREAEPLGNGYFRIDDLIFNIGFTVYGGANIEMAMLCTKCGKPMTIVQDYAWGHHHRFEISGLIGLAETLDDYYVRNVMKEGKCWNCIHLPIVKTEVEKEKVFDEKSGISWWRRK